MVADVAGLCTDLPWVRALGEASGVVFGRAVARLPARLRPGGESSSCCQAVMLPGCMVEVSHHHHTARLSTSADM